MHWFSKCHKQSNLEFNVKKSLSERSVLPSVNQFGCMKMFDIWFRYYSVDKSSKLCLVLKIHLTCLMKFYWRCFTKKWLDFFKKGTLLLLILLLLTLLLQKIENSHQLEIILKNRVMHVVQTKKEQETPTKLLSLIFNELQVQQSIVLKLDKHNLVIINDCKTMWGNLEIPFLSWV